MLDGAFFYLHANVHPTARHGSPPYGLTQSGVCYFGGLFWDMDSFMTKPVDRASDTYIYELFARMTALPFMVKLVGEPMRAALSVRG